MQHSSGFLKVVNEARGKIKEVSVAEARARIEQNPKAVLVDIREDSEWANGHAAQAIHLGKGILERDIEETIPDKNAEIILYCGGGYRSALAADALRQMGYSNALSLDGGWRAYQASGLPVDK
ncbi:MAG: rhodanese-like domain-containing protein [Limisphaerales bacterium]